MNSPATMRRGKNWCYFCFEDFVGIFVDPDPDPELFGHLISGSETESDLFYNLEVEVCVIWANFAVLRSCGSASP